MLSTILVLFAKSKGPFGPTGSLALTNEFVPWISTFLMTSPCKDCKRVPPCPPQLRHWYAGDHVTTVTGGIQVRIEDGTVP